MHRDATVRPILTIAIPTFDHCRYLEQLLESLSPQLRSETRVELIISDNGSSDETERVVSDEQGRGTKLTYIRNEANIGPDANFLQCYERAAGRYVWLIGDDDLLRPGAVAKVLDHISRDDYDLIYVASSVVYGDRPQLRAVDSGIRVRVLTDALQYVRLVNIFTTFISGNIVNKDRVAEVEHSPFSMLIGTNLIQLGWTFTALRGHRKSLHVSGGMLLTRPSFRGGYGLCHVFGVTLFQVTQEWLGIPRLNRLILNATLQKFFPPALWGRRRVSHADFVREDPHSVLAGIYGSSLRYWIFDYPLIVLPSAPAFVWYFMVRVINRLDRACGFPLLLLPSRTLSRPMGRRATRFDISRRSKH